MSLRDEFHRSGNWLFRHRGWLPVAMVGLFALAMRGFQYPLHSHALDEAWEAFCLFISCSGLVLRCLVVGYAPCGTSGRNTRGQVASRLNTTGAYSVVRHPLYLGNFLMWLGISLFPRVSWVVAIYCLAFLLYYERIMYAEEEYLRRRFGPQFLAWSRLTPALLPRFRNYRAPDLPFSLRNVLRREYNGLMAMVLVYFMLEEIGERLVLGHFVFDLPWVLLAGVTCVSWLLLRTLKRHSRILHVDGR